MKKYYLLFLLATLFISATTTTKYVGRTGHIHVESKSRYLDVIADNYQVYCELNPNSGAITIKGLTKSFEFKMGAIDRAFNSSRVNLGEYGKFNFTGSLMNLSEIDFTKEGRYNIDVKGDLEIGKYIRKTKASGTLYVKADGTIRTETDFEMKIEEESVETINKLMKEKLPSVISLDADQLGISRMIQLSLNVSLRPR